LVLIALSWGREVGVDVEELRGLRDARAMAERFFAPAEFASMRSLDANACQTVFFAHWTGKESLLKALGTGLGYDLDRLDVPMPSDRSVVVSFGGPDGPQRWTVRSLDVGTGYAAALAVEGSGFELRQKEWPYDVK
jgi:4'-phosphopantetheinyl transferase